jgi:hypothetical protein
MEPETATGDDAGEAAQTFPSHYRRLQEIEKVIFSVFVASNVP